MSMPILACARCRASRGQTTDEKPHATDVRGVCVRLRERIVEVAALSVAILASFIR